MDTFAKSLAGHDKDSIYAVVRCGENEVFLADGECRTIDRPKKKNLRHVQLIRKIPDDILQELGMVKRDSDLVHVLRMYRDHLRRQ